MPNFLMPEFKMQFFGVSGTYTGLPLAGGKLYTAVAGTTAGPGQASPKTTYQDYAGSSPNANPIILDSQGMCVAYLNGYYSMALYDSLGVLQYSQDNVFAGIASPAAVVVKTANATLTANDVNQIFEANTAANITITLPSAGSVQSGSWMRFKNISTGLLTVSGTIDGVANANMAQYDDLSLYTDGVGWFGRPIPQNWTYDLPDGTMINGRLSPTITGNGNLQVNILTANGGTPSPSNPVTIIIANVARQISSAAYAFANSNSGYLNMAGSEMSLKDQDLFLGVTYEANYANIVFAIFRFPEYNVFSDFAGINTDERGAVFSANGNVVVGNIAANAPFFIVGRFAANMQANLAWAVPAYNAKNLIQYPIWETRYLPFATTYTGLQAPPSNSLYYKKGKGWTEVSIYLSSNSNSTGFTCTVPLKAGNYGGPFAAIVPVVVQDNGGNPQMGQLSLANASNTCNISPNVSGGSWTASGTKTLYTINFRYYNTINS